MKKRRNVLPHNVITWIKQGYGQGVGSFYRPFLYVRDVPSRGRSCMVLGLRTGRIHHYLSDLEYKFHVLAEYNSNVLDIREQYALLPWSETQEIAANLNITHSVYQQSKTPIIMTTDIVLTIQDENRPRYAAISIKPESELDIQNKKTYRVAEKLLIEKTYWEHHGIPWRCLTDADINQNRFHNLNNLRASVAASELDWINQYKSKFVVLFNRYWNSQRTLNDILDCIAPKHALDRYHSYMLFGRTVWGHLLNVNLDEGIIRHNRPVSMRVGSHY